MTILLVIVASSIALAAEDPVCTSSDRNKVRSKHISPKLYQVQKQTRAENQPNSDNPLAPLLLILKNVHIAALRGSASPTQYTPYQMVDYVWKHPTPRLPYVGLDGGCVQQFLQLSKTVSPAM